MAKSRTVELRFPTGGLVRRYGYQSQPPYTTPSCSNVRPFDPLEGRERGGSRPGIVRAFAQELGSGTPIRLLYPVASVDDDHTITYTLVASSAGNVYYRNGAGAMTPASGTVNSAVPMIQAAPHSQKLYLADYRTTRVSGIDGTIASNNRLASASIAKWTDLGINTAKDYVLITGAVSTAQDNLYAISDVADDYITISGSMTDDSDGDLLWEICRPVKVFDPTTGVVSVIAVTYGIAPGNCPLICTYRERLVLAGPEQIWYMSRMGDPTDWDYGYDPSDPARPVAGSSSEAGEIGEPVTALIPYSDDFLIFGCPNSLWVMRGDPAFGGQIDSLSREIGCVGAASWCRLPDGSILVLSRDGIYGIAPGGGQPVEFSRERLPRDLIDQDPVSNFITMAYDSRHRGIHLYVTPTDGSTGAHWWLDWATKTFWPVVLQDDHQPASIVAYASGADQERHVLLGGYDGYVRRYDDDADDDDDEDLESEVQIGPLRLGQAGQDGIIADLEADLDASSDDVDWEVHTADTPEGAVASTTAKESGTFSAGRNRPAATRVRGAAATIRLSSTGRWAMETAALTVHPGGRIR